MEALSPKVDGDKDVGQRPLTIRKAQHEGPPFLSIQKSGSGFKCRLVFAVPEHDDSSTNMVQHGTPTITSSSNYCLSQQLSGNSNNLIMSQNFIRFVFWLKITHWLK